MCVPFISRPNFMKVTKPKAAPNPGNFSPRRFYWRSFLAVALLKVFYPITSIFQTMGAGQQKPPGFNFRRFHWNLAGFERHRRQRGFVFVGPYLAHQLTLGRRFANSFATALFILGLGRGLFRQLKLSALCRNAGRAGGGVDFRLFSNACWAWRHNKSPSAWISLLWR